MPSGLPKLRNSRRNPPDQNVHAWVLGPWRSRCVEAELYRRLRLASPEQRKDSVCGCRVEDLGLGVGGLDGCRMRRCNKNPPVKVVRVALSDPSGTRPIILKPGKPKNGVVMGLQYSCLSSLSRFGAVLSRWGYKPKVGPCGP